MLPRLASLIRRLLAWFLPRREREDPDGLLAVERESLRKQIASYNLGLAAHASLCERLIAQIRRQEADEEALEARVRGNLNAGNKEAAGLHALQLQTLRRELAENRTQAAAAEQTYQELIRTRDVAIREAQRRINAVRTAIANLKAQNTAADLTEMASGMIGQVGTSGDTLSRLHEIVEAERAKATGRARVARDVLEVADVMRMESQQQALAEAALAEFTAPANLATDSLPPVPAAPSGQGQDVRQLQARQIRT